MDCCTLRCLLLLLASPAFTPSIMHVVDVACVFFTAEIDRDKTDSCSLLSGLFPGLCHRLFFLVRLFLLAVC